MLSCDQTFAILGNNNYPQRLPPVGNEQLIDASRPVPRRDALPCVEPSGRGTHSALAIVADVLSGLGVLETEPAVLFDAEPSIHLALTFVDGLQA